MLSGPAVHKILFSLSVLFGLNSPFVSEEVSVHIDRKIRTGRISYQQLLSTEKKAERINAAFRKLGNVERFGNKVEGIRFKEALLHSPEGDPRLEVFFTYEDEDAMFQQLGIEKDDQERLRFHLGGREELLESNGAFSDGSIRWDDDVRKLHWKLSGQPLEQEERMSAVEIKGQE